MLKYVLSALVGAAISASAQVTPTVPPSVPAVKVLAGPPRGFDPLSATVEELQRYGIPPKPDQVQNPKLFEIWHKAVTGKTNIQPTLNQTQIYHKPARLKEVLPETPAIGKNQTAISSTNWSGIAIYDPTLPFAISYIVSYFTVPVAQQAFGSSTGTWDYSAQWVGIDGFANSDVMQAGTEVDAYSSGGGVDPFYSFWIEWFPNAESQVSGFPLGSGDTVFVEVWNVSPTSGYAYLANESTGQAASFSLTAPSGAQLQGSSAEWVVERPEVGNALATLTNYVADSFAFCGANGFNYQVGYYPGYAPSGTVYSITMLNNDDQPISYPTVTGEQSIWFWDEGTAR